MHCHKSLNITGFYWPATLLWSLYVTKVVKRRHYLTRSFHITGRALSDCHEIWPHTVIGYSVGPVVFIWMLHQLHTDAWPPAAAVHWAGRQAGLKACSEHWSSGLSLEPNASLVLIFLSLWLHAYWIDQLLLHRENITNYFAEHSNWQGRLKCFCFAYSTY